MWRALLVLLCAAGIARATELESSRQLLLDAAATHTSTHHESALATQQRAQAEVHFSTLETINAVKADLVIFARAFNYDGGFIMQAGTAAMAMGCRLDTYEMFSQKIRDGEYKPMVRKTITRPLHDVDVWIPSSAWPTLRAAILLNRQGAVTVAGGFEWPPASALGNTHELDIRDGRKAWGDYGILSYIRNREDTGVDPDDLEGNHLYILKCSILMKQKAFLASQSSCERAHANGIDCDNPPGLLDPARPAYNAAIALGAGKRAQDRVRKVLS